ncbi:hypothetical protein CBM2592_B10270 [Cupriavidus taiwanensis]|nr:hypothetical protein CBM2592_B10270 [Cupriavidus taiwanensis]SOY92117.1 hypothetical protein CBM2591_B10268 [Cupriavidus taiwanensis]SOZ65914.1 hypothetical protein CBM2617_B10108 [Cupriavidus taiwanensis]
MSPGDDAYPILRAPAKGQVDTRRNIAYPFLRVGWPRRRAASAQARSARRRKRGGEGGGIEQGTCVAP